MQHNTYLENIYEKLRKNDFELRDSIVNNTEVVTATRKQVKLSWLTPTKMNFFVAIGVVDHISKEMIESFSEISLSYAIRTEKGPRGLNSAVASFAVLVSSNVDEDAALWAQQGPKTHFAAIEMPVISDRKTNKLCYYREIPSLADRGISRFPPVVAIGGPGIRGAIFYKSCRSFVKEYFG